MKKNFENPIINIDVFDKENIVTNSVSYVDGLNDIDANRRIQVNFNDMVDKTKIVF